MTKLYDALVSKRKGIKQRILKEMAVIEEGNIEYDIGREYMLIEIVTEHPYLNNPKDREKIRELYQKYKALSPETEEKEE